MHDQITELTSNRRLLKLKEFISNESNDKAGLPDCCISQQDEFEMADSVAHCSRKEVRRARFEVGIL